MENLLVKTTKIKKLQSSERNTVPTQVELPTNLKLLS